MRPALTLSALGVLFLSACSTLPPTREHSGERDGHDKHAQCPMAPEHGQKPGMHDKDRCPMKGDQPGAADDQHHKP